MNIQSKVLLTIKYFPQTKRGKEKICNWLHKITEEIWESDPEDYSKKNVRCRLQEVTRIRK
jgi:hypothetical protein